MIILDEPVNGLDIEGVVEIREIIKKLNAEKNDDFSYFKVIWQARLKRLATRLRLYMKAN